jgi:hypothetical protein
MSAGAALDFPLTVPNTEGLTNMEMSKNLNLAKANKMFYPVGARDKAASLTDIPCNNVRARDLCYVICASLVGSNANNRDCGIATIKWDITFYGKRYFLA